MAFDRIKAGLLAAALTTGATLGFSGSAQAHPPGYRYGWHYGWHKAGHKARYYAYTPGYLATPVLYKQRVVWTADGWRYASPPGAAQPASGEGDNGLLGLGLLGF